MIRPIDIRLNAAHPELPLAEAVTFTGSPSTVLIRGVPPNCGRWAITAVFVAASFPDGSTTTRAAVQSANGVWVATLPATATSGRTANGIRVMADGIDENGDAVTGYILGVADFAVASLGVTPAPEPGGVAYALRYFDALPDPARKGDVIRVNGDLKFYNGTAWQPFTDLSNYYTAEQVDEAIDKLAAYYITADAQGNPFATHAALVNAQTYYSGGAVRIPTRNDYAVVSADETHGGAEWRYIYAVDAQGVGQWEPQYAVEGVIAYDNTVSPNSGNGVKSSGIWSAIWGALSALPAGFTSLYDWCVSQLAGKASKADATLMDANTWTFADGLLEAALENIPVPEPEEAYLAIVTTSQGYDAVIIVSGGGHQEVCGVNVNARDARVSFGPGWVTAVFPDGSVVATRAALQGYQLGSQSDKPLASEAEAEALRDGKLDRSDVVAPSTSSADSGKAADAKATGDALAGKLSTSGGTVAGGIALYNPTGQPGTAAIYFPTGGNGKLYFGSGLFVVDDANQRVTIKGIDAATVSAIPYDLGTPTVIDSASSETVEGETVNYGAATLANRTANIVQVTAATALDELRITFPAATSGKVRDFGLRVEIGTGSAALTAPALVPVAPTGETIKIENADKTIPALADGTATAKGVTLLYFSETAPGVFVVKGEQVEEVA